MKNFYVVAMLVLLPALPCRAWRDKAHLAMAQAAGHPAWYNASAADALSIKSSSEPLNHFYNAADTETITAETVIRQIPLYDTAKEGHLYGAIVSAYRQLEAKYKANRFDGPEWAFLMHYIGDLSCPAHNRRNDSFAMAHHAKVDAILDGTILADTGKIKSRMPEMRVANEQELIDNIVLIANKSHELAVKCFRENRDPTEEETYAQLAHSAALIKATLKTIPLN